MANVFRYIMSNIKRINVYRNINSKDIMTSSFRADKALEQLKQNPHYDKYADKISKLQSSAPDELVHRLEKIHVKKVNNAVVNTEERQFSKPLEAKTDCVKSNDPLCTKQKYLNNIMKMELILDKSPEETKQIWEEYHKHKDVIAATIPNDMYDKIIMRSKQYPVFLFPLPRDQGYEYIVCQFSGNEVHFTPLINYQAHKENAPECLTLVHYTELKEKGIILMRGEFNKDILSSKEALCLANQLQLYYCMPNDKRKKLLERFTLTPDQFQHMDLIAELECLTL